MNQKRDIQIKFLVQGSASEPYELSFRKSGDNIIALCTCPAALNGLHCKHRLGIFRGSCKGIVSGNENQVALVQSWLPGTDIECLLNLIAEAESTYKNAKSNLAKLNKKLARAMYGGGS
ncbi:MAG: hypothetical protein SVO01_05155 [Thermotogota bacterium]|nr:hypothetical protein [Thermotogota bacterium]